MALKPEKSGCFICSQSIPDIRTDPDNGVPGLFEFLCQLFGLHSAFQDPSLFGSIENSDLCLKCSEIISDGLKIRQQIQALQTKLEVLSDTLKNQILSNYRNNGENGEVITTTKAKAKRLFAQCLGTCCVVIPRIPDDKKRLTRPRRNLGKQNQQDLVIVDVSNGQEEDFERKHDILGRRKEENAADDDTNVDSNPDEGVSCEEFCPDDNASNPDDSLVPPAAKRERRGSEKSITRSRSKKVRRKRTSCKKDGVLISFVCKTCKQEFKRETYKTSDDSYSYRCELEKCPRVYRDFHKFRRHHGLNCPERPKRTMVICEQCGAAYCSAAALGNHVMRTHTKEFRFYCDQCGAGFVNNARLQLHMLNHTGVKKFKCEQCESSFKRKEQLDVHMRRHSNERPFVCSMCGKGFGSLQHLRTHETTHSLERNIKCTHCERMFASKHQVRVHIYSAHKELRKKKTATLQEGSETLVPCTTNVQMKSNKSISDDEEQNEEAAGSYISPGNSLVPDTAPGETINPSQQCNDFAGPVGSE